MTADREPFDVALLHGAVDEVAPRLLGALVRSRGVLGRVVEVEAYDDRDPASHSARGRTRGNASMFGPAGLLYVYVSHGLHHCGNVVIGEEGHGAAVLLRAIEVLAGRDRALARRGGRGAHDDRLLSGGPGRVGQALALRPDDDGHDLLGPREPVLLAPVGAGTDVRRGPRVGVRLAADRQRRWWLADSPAVSRYRRHPSADATGA